MGIQVTARISAPLAHVWAAYTTPADIVQWNAASDDWHTTEAEVDLRPGGAFRSRMEAKDGSFGFDFEGVYTSVETMRRIAYDMGGRSATVTFTQDGDAVVVVVEFDPEGDNPEDMQRDGWQAILDRFARHAVATK